MTEKWKGRSLSWNDMLRTAKDKGNVPWSMEMVKVGWLDWDGISVSSSAIQGPIHMPW